MASSLIVAVGASSPPVKGNGNGKVAEVDRPLANFPPSIWGDTFTSITIDNEVREAYQKEFKELKDKIKKTFEGKEEEEEMMNLINRLERLGVAYHFEEEIETQLEKMFKSHVLDSKFKGYDLFTTALFFRVFRQHGYNISSSVFKKFKDTDDQFKQVLKEDLEGMLSLYEATHLRTHDDDVLDKAFSFTSTHLESMAANLIPSLREKVVHALKQSLHKGIPRVETRYYISIYQEDPSKNETLLRFAKLDFNLVQMLHKEELCQLSRWWKELEFASKIPYARNRAVECYLWAMGVFFEPKYGNARVMAAKIMLMLSITDDTYDAYGTRDELQTYTQAIQRWEIGEVHHLPEYMQFVYKALIDLYQEIKDELSEQGNSYGVQYSIETFKEVVKCYNTETKWCNQKFVPKFDEYMCNYAIVTSANFLLATSSFMGMGEVATVEVFDWAQSKPKCLIASNTIGRLINDIVSHEEEQTREHGATGVECYMKEHGVTKEEAISELYIKIENAWKDINEECLKPTSVPMPFLKVVLNLTRVLDVVYKDEDGYTHPEKVLKPHVLSLFVDAIPII